MTWAHKVTSRTYSRQNQVLTKDHEGALHPGVGRLGQLDIDAAEFGVDLHADVRHVLVAAARLALADLALARSEALRRDAQVAVARPLDLEVATRGSCTMTNFTVRTLLVPYVPRSWGQSKV